MKKIEKLKNMGKELQDTLPTFKGLQDKLLSLTDGRNLPEDEIIYLTGMSINKKTFHKIYKFILKDQDYVNYIDKIRTYITKSKAPLDFNIKIGPLKSTNSDMQALATNSIGKIISMLKPIIQDNTNILPLTRLVTDVGISNIPFSYVIVKKGLDYYLKDFNKIADTAIHSQDIIKELLNGLKGNRDTAKFINELAPADFFAIYQSNQSDSRGLVPLASDTSTDFALNYGFSDLPFYENLFINDVSIEIISDRLIKHSKDISLAIETAFLAHGLDIFLSRLMAFYVDKDIKLNSQSSDENNSTQGSYNTFIEKMPQSDKKQFSDSFRERNLFGIDLLSRVLSCFSSILNPDYIEKRQEQEKPKIIKVYINEECLYVEHLIELFECASTNSLFYITHNRDIADLELAMTFWQGDGINKSNQDKQSDSKGILEGFVTYNKGSLLSKSIKRIRVPIKLFMSIPQIMSINDNYNDNEEVKIYENNFSKYYDGDGKELKPIYKLVKKNYNYYSNILCPKPPLTHPLYPFDSISLDQIYSYKEKPKVLIPHRLIHDSKDAGDLNILTVGGIEHNRPLMRLINAHRMQKGIDRNLGFFDNIFDFLHREHNEETQKHYFLAGVNQPVSGFNALLSQREDDLDGNSVSTSAKLIYFRVNGVDKEGELKPFHVLSIYGFSALASAFATLFIIYKIKNNVKGNYSLMANAIANDEFQDSDVFTRRIIFKTNNYMEARFHEICDSLEYFSFVRVDKDKKLEMFITSLQEGTDSISPKTPVIDNRETGIWSLDTGKSAHKVN